MNSTKPYIVCAALRNPHDHTDLICGPRHHHCFEYFRKRFGKNLSSLDDWEQGFADQRGHFYSRSDAHRMVRITGQMKDAIIGGELTSEDLY